MSVLRIHLYSYVAYKSVFHFNFKVLLRDLTKRRSLSLLACPLARLLARLLPRSRASVLGYEIFLVIHVGIPPGLKRPKYPGLNRVN